MHSTELTNDSIQWWAVVLVVQILQF